MVCKPCKIVSLSLRALRPLASPRDVPIARLESARARLPHRPSSHAKTRAHIGERSIMAKWGEGDSRWIVQERDDGTNPNAWHWVERNLFKWSEEKLTELLVGVDLNVPVVEGYAKITTLTKFEGDSSVSTRKGGKKFGCFDLSFTLKWSGRAATSSAEDLDDDDVEVKGEIKVKEFCSTNDEDEYEYTVSVSDGKSEVKELLKSRVEKTVEATLLPYFRQFASELQAL